MASEIVKEEITVVITKKTTYKYNTTEQILTEERHYTDKEIADNHRYMSDNFKDYTKKIYGEKAAIEQKTFDTKIFEQTINANEFNLKIVIGAINGV